LLAVCASRSVWLTDATIGRPGRKLGSFGKNVEALSFSPDGRLLAAGSRDGRVRIWEAASGRGVADFDWEAGKVNAIAAATAQRWPDMPDVPTFTEVGLPFVYDSWFGLLTQAAVPRPVVQKINKDVTELLKSPETIAKLKAQFVIPVTDTPEAFDDIIRRETANLAEVFKEAGVGN